MEVTFNGCGYMRKSTIDVKPMNIRELSSVMDVSAALWKQKRYLLL